MIPIASQGIDIGLCVDQLTLFILPNLSTQTMQLHNAVLRLLRHFVRIQDLFDRSLHQL